MRSRSLFTPAALALFVGCQFQASCGSGKNLDTTKLREFVSSALERDVGQPPTQVTCPDKIKIDKGKTFECTVMFGTASAIATLSQESDRGDVKITTVTGVLIARRLEAAIADSLGSKLNAHFKVECGERVRASTPGDKFTCTATDARGAGGKVAVEVKDRDGNVRFDLVPDAPSP